MSTIKKTEEEIWAEAQGIRVQQKKEAEQPKSGNYERYWENVSYLGLKIGEAKAFRIYGVPIEVRRDKYDPKVVMMSKILTDKGDNKIPVIWPHIINGGKYVPDPDYILCRLMRSVQDSDYVKYVDADVGTKDNFGNAIIRFEDKIINEKTRNNGRYIPKHSEKVCYKRIRDNFFNINGNTIKSSFYPSVRITMNVLDRLTDWCKTNSSWQVLTNKLGEKTSVDEKGVSQTRYFPDLGIAFGSYIKINDHFKHFNTGFMNCDVVVERTKNGDTYGMTLFDATTAHLPENIKKVVVEGPLTEEEKAYTLVDLDKLNPVSSYSTLQTHLKGLFRTVDLELGTNYLKELDELVDAEKAKFREENKVEKAKEIPAITETQVVEEESLPFNPDPPKVEEVSPIRETTSVVETQRAARSSVTDSGINTIQDLPFWSNLDEIDQADMIEHAVIINGEVNYPKAETKLVACSNAACEKMLPAAVYNCPHCGTSLA